VADVFQHRDSEKESTELAPSTRQLCCFALAWLVVPLLFFSFSGSKLPGYIMPAVPPAIVIAGILLARLITKNEVWRYPVQVIALGMLLIVYVTISFAVPSYADQESVKSLIAAADLRGFSQNKLIGYQSVSHNAEFYGAGRLFREPDGKQ
jgi:glucan phosphoethanolaminetransferase (alkaline phosphatase superfamily)